MEEKLASYEYEGNELSLFANAFRWKSYFGSRIKKYIGSDVLEVGAGIGGTTRMLCADHVTRWVCLEPDVSMATVIHNEIREGTLPTRCEVIHGTLPSPKVPDSSFDSVLYIDVLEHIEDDENELKIAASHLKTGGHLIVLSPAHPMLYSPFDNAVGHYRRYSRSALVSLHPPSMQLVHVEFLDSLGLLASLANRMLLKQEEITPSQITMWDRYMIPISKVLDPLIGRRLGKSILAIWQKK